MLFNVHLILKMLHYSLAELNTIVSRLSSVGAAAATQSDDECECGSGLLHPNLILGLIIWLLILTLLVSVKIPRQTAMNG